MWNFHPSFEKEMIFWTANKSQFGMQTMAGEAGQNNIIITFLWNLQIIIIIVFPRLLHWWSQNTFRMGLIKIKKYNKIYAERIFMVPERDPSSKIQ